MKPRTVWPQQLASGHVGVVWPALPSLEALRLKALLEQLQISEWSTEQEIRSAQFEQLQQLLLYTHSTIAFYRARLDAAGYHPGMPITPEWWARVPLLTRGEVQQRKTELFSRSVPPDQAPLNENQTSGSTGQPVTVLGTAVTRLMWNAITLRHYHWHLDNPQGTLGAIRALSKDGVLDGGRARSWGRPFSHLHATGPAVSTDCRQDVGALLDWLDRERPDHLLVFPSTLEAMLRQLQSQSRQAPRLSTVICLSESLSDEVRTLARDVLGCRVVDMYSAQEVGYIALQCPDGAGYHVQAESLLVEVLDEENRPCAPGQVGRVALTTLNNFASPLLRYLIGDYAVAGAACACGRGLPVLERIVGRTRNLITLPDGRRYWPVMYSKTWSGIAPIRQLQLIQKTRERFLVRAYMDRELLETEKEQLVAAFRSSLGYPFEFAFERVGERIVAPNGKFDTIVSEVPPPA